MPFVAARELDHRSARGAGLGPDRSDRVARGAGLGPDRSDRVARGAGLGPDRSDWVDVTRLTHGVNRLAEAHVGVIRGTE